VGNKVYEIGDITVQQDGIKVSWHFTRPGLDDGLGEQTLPRRHHSVEWFAREASMLQKAH
jgi:hypothetical protein